MTDANDPNLQSWVDIPSGSDFPIQNLPFGIFKTSKGHPRAGVAIGDQILDLAILFDEGFFSGIEFPLINVFDHKFLNSFLSLGKPIISDVRNRISTLLRSDNPELTDKETLLENLLVPQQQATMMVPVKVGDYTDFYSSIEHATNVGSM
ncbi:MAG: fumarylacetoacetase, partial [Bacteroidetes bacterium]|nr:fumarylacetoacetase [Bacteroidota bacterium]